MGKPNKTDWLDARGLGILLHNGALPECWIPPGELRDQRQLLRTRMALRDMLIKLKLRVHAALDRYGLQAEGISDLFGKCGHFRVIFPSGVARKVQHLATNRIVTVRELAPSNAVDDFVAAKAPRSLKFR